MSIEFIRDDFLEGKKEELVEIEKELSYKHKKMDVNVLFLKRFTLALMGQYKIKNLYKKNENIEQLNRQIMDKTNKMHGFKTPVQRIMPQPPLSIPTPRGLNIPMPQRINIPAPLKEQLRIPKPIPVDDVPKQEIKKEPKKEFSTPSPL